MKTFVKKYAFHIIAAIVVILFAIDKINSSLISRNNTNTAVSQNEIENLQNIIQNLQAQTIGYKDVQKKLIVEINKVNKKLTDEQTKRKGIADKYNLLKSKLHEITNDSAVSLFLDRADLCEFLVLKYDSSYLIPIEAIQFHNIMAIDFDQQKEENESFKKEIVLMQSKDLTMQNLIEVKDLQISSLNKIASNHELIITEKDKQIATEHRKYKLQKVKTYIVGGIGIVSIIAALTIN